MSDQQANAAGVVLKTQAGKTYFIPQKLLDGFAVGNPAGIEALDHAAKNPVEQHAAYSVSIDRDLLRQVFIF
jgi:hypothetical protein